MVNVLSSKKNVLSHLPFRCFWAKVFRSSLCFGVILGDSKILRNLSLVSWTKFLIGWKPTLSCNLLLIPAAFVSGESCKNERILALSCLVRTGRLPDPVCLWSWIKPFSPKLWIVYLQFLKKLKKIIINSKQVENLDLLS